MYQLADRHRSVFHTFCLEIYRCPMGAGRLYRKSFRCAGSWLVFGQDMLTNGLVSVTHVVFWTPAVCVLAIGLKKTRAVTIYNTWHALALLTMMISLFFDYQDSLIFLFLNPNDL
ncbi:MAG: hypothetical protein ACI8Z1_001702 [Candidatus Azotimanducaceae bacterium]